MKQKQTPKPANDDTAEATVIETRHGRVSFEDVSIDDMMASFDTDAEKDKNTQRQE